MNNQAIEVIAEAKKQFTEIIDATPENVLIWKSEANFARQAIMKNDHNWKAAVNNPALLRDAIINVASIGLSLNPATAYAYLVPRDNAICLDVSYKGLIKMATDTGSIMWCRADVVYDADEFNYNGPAMAPTHAADPFSKNRGQVVGVYCIAKTCDGDILTEVMTEEELVDIKSKSKSTTGKNPQYSPWNTFPNEMRKKCVIKRASKTWPRTDRHERLAKVIEYVNKEEGIDFNEPTEEDINLMSDYLHQKNGAAIANLRNQAAEKSLYWAKIQKTFAAKGQIGKHQEMVQGWIDEAVDYVSGVAVTIQDATENKPDAVLEAYEELNEHEALLFWANLDPEAKINIENILHSVNEAA